MRINASATSAPPLSPAPPAPPPSGGSEERAVGEGGAGEGGGGEGTEGVGEEFPVLRTLPRGNVSLDTHFLLGVHLFNTSHSNIVQGDFTVRFRYPKPSFLFSSHP